MCTNGECEIFYHKEFGLSCIHLTLNAGSCLFILQQPSSPTANGRAGRPVSADPPPFPGASKHVHHPHACSTPRKNDPQPQPRHVHVHARSATEPTAVGELQAEATGEGGPDKHQGTCMGSEPLKSVSIDGAVSHPRKSRRKDVQVKRKINTEQMRHKRSRSADTKKNHDLNNRESASADGPLTERNAPLNLHDHGLQMHCSSMPNFCPYHHRHHPYYAPPIPFGSQYPTIALPLPSLVCPHCALAQQQQALPPQWPRRAGGEERENHSGGPSQQCNSVPGVSMGTGPTDNTEQPLSSAPCTRTTKATTTGVVGDGSTSSVHSIQLLAEEMLSTLQHDIDAIKKIIGLSKCQRLV